MEKIIIHYSRYRILNLLIKLDHTTDKKEFIVIVNLLNFWLDADKIIINFNDAAKQLKKLLINLIDDNDNDIKYYGFNDNYDINELLNFKQFAFKLLDRFN